MDLPFDFESQLAARATLVERRLADRLDGTPRPGEIVLPPRILSAMRYALLGGGKRIRPFLVMEAAALFMPDADTEAAALDVAAALECIHTYSLVHDDLPAMDDDALRRGRPTLHIAYDEATAILAGDALLTLAFDMVTDPSTSLAPERRVALVSALSRAAGFGGMVGGQMIDLASENRHLSEEEIVTLQAMKTGALLRFACEAGAIVCGATPDDRERLSRFGEAIGLAFQLADDLLDLTADEAAMGKATGKDADRGKATLVSLHGAEWAHTQLRGLVDAAVELLEPFGDRAEPLRQAAGFIANRRN
ncbi:(2E,6E)-farnesyl diphosphate synthase [Rhizobium albus]|nr:(2E,6E)-farnesyl diphosphate synthase [Rhizobium albus]